MISATLCAIIAPSPVVQVLSLAGVKADYRSLRLVLPELVNEPAIGATKSTRLVGLRRSLARSRSHCGPNSEIAPSPKSARGLNRSRGRALRRAAWPCQQWMERWQRLT